MWEELGISRGMEIGARHLYHSFGFVETGEKDCNELIAVLKL